MGWIAEIVYGVVVSKRILNPGFLRLPLLPIYGTGAVIIVFLISPYVDNPFLLFIASAVAATIVEYLTHLVLDKAFRIQLWNYDDKKFNLQGRVALDMSITFGVLALLLVYIIHPAISPLVELVPPLALIIISFVLGGLVLLDAANAVTSLTRLRLSDIKGAIEDIQASIVEQIAKLTTLTPKSKGRARRTWLRLHNSNIKRLRRVFPNARISARRSKSS